jgi:hypothetical protein
MCPRLTLKLLGPLELCAAIKDASRSPMEPCARLAPIPAGRTNHSTGRDQGRSRLSAGVEAARAFGAA